MNSPAWLQELLNDEAITDLCLNGVTAVFIDRGLGMQAYPLLRFWDSDEQLRAWVLARLSEVGKSWDAKHPFVDATIRTGQTPDALHRLHCAFPPICQDGVLVSLRRLPRPPKPEKAERWKGAGLFPKLAEIVRSGESLLIAGATGSGKTTLACDLLQHVPEDQRIVALEDTPELATHHPHFLSLQSRPPNSDGFGEVNLRQLIRQTLRMRPDRIILGECRGGEVLDLLQLLNTGHGGALATLHANSAREAMKRLELLCMLAAPPGLTLSAIRELLAGGLRWVVHLKRLSGERKISELCRVEGREGDTILMRQVIEPGHNPIETIEPKDERRSFRNQHA
jgi:pilus assembly protein CpaF